MLLLASPKRSPPPNQHPPPPHAPHLDLDLRALLALPHAAVQHRAEVLGPQGEVNAAGVYGEAVHDEGHVAQLPVVHQLPHVLLQSRRRDQQRLESPLVEVVQHHLRDV